MTSSVLIPPSLSDPLFTFDEREHLYRYDGKPLQGATSWISRYKRPFDTATVAARVAARSGRAPADVIAEWSQGRDEAGVLGSLVHEAIENYLIGKPVPTLTADANNRYMLFQALWNGRLRGASALACELRVFSLRYRIAGTMDLLCRLPNGRIFIGDWKTNKKFTHGVDGYATLLAPFDRYMENKLNEYAIQIALYRLMLEEHGLEVDGGFIAHLPKGGKEAAVHFPPDLRREVRAALEAA